MASILLVEDDEDLSFGLQMFLQSQSHDVLAVYSGFEAVEQLRYGNFDVVILDQNLPELSGNEICKEYRTSGGTTPILMLTGSVGEKNRALGMEAGASDFLAKPFQVDELLKRINKLLAPVS